MAFTQSDLDAVNSAVASGELKIEMQGRLVIYRNMDDLLKARAIIVSELAASQAAPTAVRRGSYAVRFTSARGF